MKFADKRLILACAVTYYNTFPYIAENADSVSADAGTRAVTEIEASLDDNTTRKPASRKNRFAALAQNFNDYEDDLSQHSFE